MSPSRAIAWGGAGAAAALALAALLRRMRGEFEREGRLRASTVAAMYAAYATHAGIVGIAAVRRTLPMPAPGAAETTGGALIAAGVALSLAGVSRFSGPRQISGTESGSLETGGIYRISRNPQYAGYVTALVGLGLARRSAAVVCLAAPVATAFRAWVPVEERRLRREFGDDYAAYLQSAPRWLGRPRSARAPGRTRRVGSIRRGRG